MKDVIESTSSYQALKCAELMYKYIEIKRNWKPIIKWFYGPPKSGKTETAIKEAIDLYKDYWISDVDLQWWDGYDAHEAIIIDDFREHFCSFNELMKIIDKYPYRVRLKGSSRQLLAKHIWITCPFHPSQLWHDGNLLRLVSKLDEIRQFDTEVEGNSIASTS